MYLFLCSLYKVQNHLTEINYSCLTPTAICNLFLVFVFLYESNILLIEIGKHKKYRDLE